VRWSCTLQYEQQLLVFAIEIRSELATQFPFFSLFSAKATGPIFTEIIHDIVALAALLNHAYIRRYPIPFPNRARQ